MSEFYENEKYKTGELTDIFNTLPMVQEFRAMSNDIAKTYDREVFTEPTSHQYPINKTEFKRSFSTYLQSFEISILAESTNETLKKFPEAQLLYHFHDGNVIAVKETETFEFLKEMQAQVKTTTEKLKLKEIQKIELQCSYPTRTFISAGSMSADIKVFIIKVFSKL